MEDEKAQKRRHDKRAEQPMPATAQTRPQTVTEPSELTPLVLSWHLSADCLVMCCAEEEEDGAEHSVAHFGNAEDSVNQSSINSTMDHLRHHCGYPSAAVGKILEK